MGNASSSDLFNDKKSEEKKALNPLGEDLYKNILDPDKLKQNNASRVKIYFTIFIILLALSLLGFSLYLAAKYSPVNFIEEEDQESSLFTVLATVSCILSGISIILLVAYYNNHIDKIKAEDAFVTKTNYVSTQKYASEDFKEVYNNYIKQRFGIPSAGSAESLAQVMQTKEGDKEKIISIDENNEFGTKNLSTIDVDSAAAEYEKKDKEKQDAIQNQSTWDWLRRREALTPEEQATKTRDEQIKKAEAEGKKQAEKEEYDRKVAESKAVRAAELKAERLATTTSEPKPSWLSRIWPGKKPPVSLEGEDEVSTSTPADTATPVDTSSTPSAGEAEPAPTSTEGNKDIEARAREIQAAVQAAQEEQLAKSSAEAEAAKKSSKAALSRAAEILSKPSSTPPPVTSVTADNEPPPLQ